MNLLATGSHTSRTEVLRNHGALQAIPSGPCKGFSGIIDGVISCAGCPVGPGDLVIGDDDGVSVVPLDREAETLEAARNLLAAEKALEDAIAGGELPADKFPPPEADWID